MCIYIEDLKTHVYFLQLEYLFRGGTHPPFLLFFCFMCAYGGPLCHHVLDFNMAMLDPNLLVHEGIYRHLKRVRATANPAFASTGCAYRVTTDIVSMQVDKLNPIVRVQGIVASICECTRRTRSEGALRDNGDGVAICIAHRG